MTGTPKPTSDHELARAAAAGITPFLSRLAGFDQLFLDLFTAADAARFGFTHADIFRHSRGIAAKVPATG